MIGDKRVRSAMLVAKEVAEKIGHGLPDALDQSLRMAKGGSVDDASRTKNLMRFMEGAHPEMFNQDGTPRVFYHGTGADFGSFSHESMYSGEGGSHGGSGFYFTTDPESASNYAMLARQKGGSGKVIPVHLSLKKPLPISWEHGEVMGADLTLSPAQVQKIILAHPNIRSTEESPLLNFGDMAREGFNKVLNKAVKSYAGYNNIAALRNDFYGDDHGRWLKALHDATGYDSAVQELPNGQKHFIAWFPSQIKSATGNEGTFDPSDPDITKADGGAIKDYPDPYADMSAIQKAVELAKGFWNNQRYAWGENPAWLAHMQAPEQYAQYFKQHYPEMGSLRVNRGPLDVAINYAGGYDWAARPEVSPEDARNMARQYQLSDYVLPGRKESNEVADYAQNMAGVERALADREQNRQRSHEEVAALARKYAEEEAKRGYARPLKKAGGGDVEGDEASDNDDLPQRALNEQGLFSGAAEAARNLPQKSGAPQQMIGMLKNTKGVKPDEIKWSGVEAAMQGRDSVTRDELADYLEQNLLSLKKTYADKYKKYSTPGGSQYRETIYSLPSEYSKDRTIFNHPHWNVNNPVLHTRMSDRSETPNVPAAPKPNTIVKWPHRDGRMMENPGWTTDAPGLVIHKSPESKSEFTLTHEPSGLAVARNIKSFWGAQALATHIAPHADWTASKESVQEQVRKDPEASDLRIGLARRATDKKDSIHIPSLEHVQKWAPRSQYFKSLRDGVDTHLLLDELQSDWGQSLRANKDEANLKRPSAAPYVTSTEKWTDLGLKHALWEAANKNFNTLIWPTAEAQAKRYPGLSTIVDSIAYHPEEQIFMAAKHGSVKHVEPNVSPERLVTLVGKHMADQILASPRNGVAWHEGEWRTGWHDIKVDDVPLGERVAGMRGYYEKILPARLLELAKQHDPDAQVTRLEKSKDKNIVGYHALPITPRMRQSILKRGFPAFKQGGDVLPVKRASGGGVKMKIGDPNKQIRAALMVARRVASTPWQHYAQGGDVDAPSQQDSFIEPPEPTPISDTRIRFNAQGPGGVQGIVTPRHMWYGSKKQEGMMVRNRARAQVYGSEERPPLDIGKMGKIHLQTLESHFAKPVDQQIADEQAALARLRQAKHLSKNANTLDKSEKLDTVHHETDEDGRHYVAYAAKGVAGHALYTSGGRQWVLNTCPGQTVGCGGGVSPEGVVDTSKGTCFAPVAESQYPGAAIRRASHAQAKHDPAMTQDWILAHTGSLRDAARKADKKNKVVLFRPNVLDESDTSSRYAIANLNQQRKTEGLPSIIANSYGKTNESHDPENGYYVTWSNIGPKTKLGASVADNIARDKARIRNTITATTASGRDFVNKQGNLTPPKNSYMVTDVKRDSPLNKAMEKNLKVAKYWSVGRPESELSPQERAEGPEGHYGPDGQQTTPDKAHFGHTTLNGYRYDYQRQHILHPRLVQVGNNPDGTPHMIPTDSRFKDDEYLPKNRFMTKNGKQAGAILMTTPTTSTSYIGHQTAFTHHVGDEDIQKAVKNGGEYEIDPPEAQQASAGREYVPPQEIKMPTISRKKRADGGMVDEDAEDHDEDMMAFPEQSYEAQVHNIHRQSADE